MSNKYKKLIFLILGLFEIIAGFALFNHSTFGGATFLILGLLFIIIMFLVDRKDNFYDGTRTH